MQIAFQKDGICLPSYQVYMSAFSPIHKFANARYHQSLNFLPIIEFFRGSLYFIKINFYFYKMNACTW